LRKRLADENCSVQSIHVLKDLQSQVVIDLRVREPGANDLLSLRSVLAFEERS
jgi:hypothetical protein